MRGPGALILSMLLAASIAFAQQQPDQPLAERTFLSILSSEQREALGSGLSLERMAGAMSRGQRTAAAAALGRLEAEDPTLETLEQVHRGYDALGLHGEAVRIGLALQVRAPEDSTGYRLAAVALNHAGDHAAAVQQAEAALRRRPDDPNALAVLKLSKRLIGQTRTPSLSPTPASDEVDGRTLERDLGKNRVRGRIERGRNALGLLQTAMSRIQVGDPREALRLLALAERADATIPDIYMQQGLAHLELGEYAVAAARFERAESMWRTNRTPENLRSAELAARGCSTALVRLAENATSRSDKGLPLPFGAIGGFGALGALLGFLLARVGTKKACAAGIAGGALAGLVVAGAISVDRSNGSSHPPLSVESAGAHNEAVPQDVLLVPKDRGRNKGQDKGASDYFDYLKKTYSREWNDRRPDDPNDPWCKLLKRLYEAERDPKIKQAINQIRKYSRCK